MDHQDWKIVTIKRTPKKENTMKNMHGLNSVFSKSVSIDISYVTKKYVASESIQSLIRKRIDMKLNQEKADQLCAFSINTFKNIESKRMLPTEKHQMAIQKQLGIQLKIQTS